MGGTDLREIITLEPGSKVSFFQASGPREGAIVNELYEDEHAALQLRFYCYIGLRGKQQGVLKNGRNRRNLMVTWATRRPCFQP